MRTRRAYLASVEDRAMRLELERGQQAQIIAAAERARIARDMHDIVAHNLSVMIALAAAFVVSLTFVPAAVAIAISKPVSERENVLVRGLKSGYAPLLRSVIGRPIPVIALAAVLFMTAGVLFGRLGQEFTPTLDEKNIVMEVKRVPSTALSQSQAMQLLIERQISKFPQVALVFSRTGTPDLAADPMPPSSSDTYIIVKPQAEWPNPSMSKEDLIKQIEAEASTKR